MSLEIKSWNSNALHVCLMTCFYNFVLNFHVLLFFEIAAEVQLRPVLGLVLQLEGQEKK